MPDNLLKLPVAQKMLSETPTVDPTALISQTHLGQWTEIGAETTISESTVGDYSYITHHCQVIYSDIGNFCSIASHCRINPGNHPLKRAALSHFSYRSRMFGWGEDDHEFFDWRRSQPVTLGHDVWLGHGVTVLPGVTIGIGAAVGAGSVVTKDIANFTVAVGVPAKPIRERFPIEIQEAIIRIAWWNWSHKELGNALEDFRELDAAAFAKKYDPAQCPSINGHFSA
jgi:phosphonate metabolism protein (transferase hexapeptide repeat family)